MVTGRLGHWSAWATRKAASPTAEARRYGEQAGEQQ